MMGSIMFGIMIAMLLAFLGIAFASVVITVCIVKDMKFWQDQELKGENGIETSKVDE